MPSPRDDLRRAVGPAVALVAARVESAGRSRDDSRDVADVYADQILELSAADLRDVVHVLAGVCAGLALTVDNVRLAIAARLGEEAQPDPLHPLRVLAAAAAQDDWPPPPWWPGPRDSS